MTYRHVFCRNDNEHAGNNREHAGKDSEDVGNASEDAGNDDIQQSTEHNASSNHEGSAVPR